MGPSKQWRSSPVGKFQTWFAFGPFVTRALTWVGMAAADGMGKHVHVDTRSSSTDVEIYKDETWRGVEEVGGMG